MQITSQYKDKNGYPVVDTDISAGEITTIKGALAHYPEQIDDSLDNRIKKLLADDKWNPLTNLNIIDIKETVNKFAQDLPDDPMTPACITLYADLHTIWKTLNP